MGAALERIRLIWKKSDSLEKKGLRRCVTNTRTPLTGRDDVNTDYADSDTDGNIETNERRARQGKPKALRLIFVSGSLKLIVSEEICGRFGFVSTDERLHIMFLGFVFSDMNSMMKCQLHV